MSSEDNKILKCYTKCFRLIVSYNSLFACLQKIQIDSVLL